jgi:hypothetical protein
MSDSHPTKYAMSASKGFSYRVPVTVQDVLTKLLKKLPSAARPIYREYYRDLMSSKKCATDSAKAMVEFVEQNFPNIKSNHNRLAYLMNEAIGKDEHVGYHPILFPIVGDGDYKDEEAEVGIEIPKIKKRQAAMPHSSPRFNNKRRKVTKVHKEPSHVDVPSSPGSTPLKRDSFPDKGSVHVAELSVVDVASLVGEASLAGVPAHTGEQSRTKEPCHIDEPSRAFELPHYEAPATDKEHSSTVKPPIIEDSTGPFPATSHTQITGLRNADPTAPSRDIVEVQEHEDVYHITSQVNTRSPSSPDKHVPGIVGNGGELGMELTDIDFSASYEYVPQEPWYEVFWMHGEWVQVSNQTDPFPWLSMEE